MSVEFKTKREDVDLQVRISGTFTIPYEGSGEWLLKLREFIQDNEI